MMDPGIAGIIGGSIGAAVGFGSAIIATWRNNVQNTRRLRLQLEHDAAQRNLERERGLQRQIYLEVVEAVAQWQDYLGSFAATDLTIVQSREIVAGASRKISKAYVIGGPDTLLALDKLLLYVAKHERSLVEIRYEFNRVVIRIKELRSDLQSAHEKIINPDLRPHDYNILGHQIEEMEGLLKNAIREEDDLIVALSKESSRAANDFGYHSLETIVAIRRELGMPLTSEFVEAYKDSLKELGEALHSNTIQSVERIKGKFGIDAPRQLH